MIDGVKIKICRIIPDERGRVMEVLRCDEELFQKFGQVYITSCYPGVVKAWHMHRKQTDLVVCLTGMVKLVLYDSREGSRTQNALEEHCIGIHNPELIRIPPGVFHGWKCVSPEEALILSVPTEPFNYKEPDEVRLPPDTPSIPYDWILTPGRKHG
jgi:dTDP-4-dehydrorhamnose 3,5-epimerase